MKKKLQYQNTVRTANLNFQRKNVVANPESFVLSASLQPDTAVIVTTMNVTGNGNRKSRQKTSTGCRALNCPISVLNVNFSTDQLSFHQITTNIWNLVTINLYQGRWNQVRTQYLGLNYILRTQFLTASTYCRCKINILFMDAISVLLTLLINL